jgi:hypothetical protein
VTIGKPDLSEGAGRFWSAIFSGITALAVAVGGGYSAYQYFSGVQKDREAQVAQAAQYALQTESARLSAVQPFNAKRLDLCGEAANAAAILATGHAADGSLVPYPDAAKRQGQAAADFWRLYWGPLGIVEDDAIAGAMVEFGNCLQGKCDKPIQTLSLAIAHACRNEVSKSFKLSLPAAPKRPPPRSKEPD